MDGNEDIDYKVSEFATPTPEQPVDDDQPNKSVLEDILKYLDEQIKKHNSFDVIQPDAEGIMSTQQQVLAHKEVVVHLRDIRTQISNKIKELV